MKLSSPALGFLAAALIATPMLAQTQIGGGICNSSTLTGTYALSMSGRQVSSAGAFTSVLQADGSATFDGLSTVTIAVSENTNQAVGTPLNWSGTYSVQSNCLCWVALAPVFYIRRQRDVECDAFQPGQEFSDGWKRCHIFVHRQRCDTIGHAASGMRGGHAHRLLHVQWDRFWAEHECSERRRGWRGVAAIRRARQRDGQHHDLEHVGCGRRAR